MPSSHSEPYTASDLLCQKITATGLFVLTKSRKAVASGSENGAVPALTTLSCHVLFGFHLQSKLRFRSTLFQLNRPEARVSLSVDTSAKTKRPSLPTAL